jgi:phage head maturation protease
VPTSFAFSIVVRHWVASTLRSSGLVLRGVAVPYGAATIVASPSPRGGRIVHHEMFDASSIPDVVAMYGRPLLTGHDDTRPIGCIRLSRSTERGMEIEAELVGADVELEGIRRRLAAGLAAGLSIGFLPDPDDEEWRPAPPGGLPLVVRRGVKIREVSLVHWPAYAGAGVTGVHLRTVKGERQHAASVAVIAAAQKTSAEVSAYLAVRRGSHPTPNQKGMR